MSPILIAATTIISLALVAYTIGVFGERNSGTLKRSHLIFFWVGLACDSTGTAIMSSMVQSSGGSISLLHPVTVASPSRSCSSTQPGDLRFAARQ